MGDAPGGTGCVDLAFSHGPPRAVRSPWRRVPRDRSSDGHGGTDGPDSVQTALVQGPPRRVEPEAGRQRAWAPHGAPRRGGGPARPPRKRGRGGYVRLLFVCLQAVENKMHTGILSYAEPSGYPQAERARFTSELVDGPLLLVDVARLLTV